MDERTSESQNIITNNTNTRIDSQNCVRMKRLIGWRDLQIYDSTFGIEKFMKTLIAYESILT